MVRAVGEVRPPKGHRGPFFKTVYYASIYLVLKMCIQYSKSTQERQNTSKVLFFFVCSAVKKDMHIFSPVRRKNEKTCGTAKAVRRACHDDAHHTFGRWRKRRDLRQKGCASATFHHLFYALV